MISSIDIGLELFPLTKHHTSSKNFISLLSYNLSDMQDFSQLPSKTVTEVLMLEVSGSMNVIFFLTFLGKSFIFISYEQNSTYLPLSWTTSLSTDENGTSSKNISHIRLSTFHAWRRWIFREGERRASKKLKSFSTEYSHLFSLLTDSSD